MSCSNPVSWEKLADYWAGDLSPADEARLEEHLMGCEPCTAEAARAAAVVQALRSFVPPIVS